MSFTCYEEDVGLLITLTCEDRQELHVILGDKKIVVSYWLADDDGNSNNIPIALQ